MSKMDPEIKASWVAALRSGEYKQTQMKLRDEGGGFCCLGVLCDLFAKEAGLRRWDAERLGGAGLEECATDDFSELPGAEVEMWSGFDPKGSLFMKGSLDHLYNHNDAGRTFSEIADAIEEQL